MDTNENRASSTQGKSQSGAQNNKYHGKGYYKGHGRGGHGHTQNRSQGDTAAKKEADVIKPDTEKNYTAGEKDYTAAEKNYTAAENPKAESTGVTEYSVTVDLDDDATLLIDEAPEDVNEPRVEVVGVRFKKAGKVYYFTPGELKFKLGDAAIVETARGLEFGDVACANRMVREKDVIQPLRPVIRIATKDDIARNEDNKKKETEAFKTGLKKIEEHKLDMKLVDVEYTFDNSKLLFYFTSAGRVDFRELVKDLASVFRTRIELRQIGIRDEAKLMGGLGVCGRPLCCASFLSDFVQVSIKMAKEQNLSLNSTKISGTCGRLMCCLRYEHESYEAELRALPAEGSTVKTEDGVGTVIEVSPMSGLLKVKLTDKADVPPKYYGKDAIKVLHAIKREDIGDDSEEPDSEQ